MLLNLDYKFKSEGYSLKMHTKDITITAGQPSGMINGVMSLVQLTRLSTLQNTLVPIECWEIEDSPLYAWRGFMLDEARHFWGMKKVKQILTLQLYIKRMLLLVICTESIKHDWLTGHCNFI